MGLQHTIGKPVSLSGTGLHTGELANVTIKPAFENQGIRFIRTDLKPPVEIIADIDNVVTTYTVDYCYGADFYVCDRTPNGWISTNVAGQQRGRAGTQRLIQRTHGDLGKIRIVKPDFLPITDDQLHIRLLVIPAELSRSLQLHHAVHFLHFLPLAVEYRLLELRLHHRR